MLLTWDSDFGIWVWSCALVSLWLVPGHLGLNRSRNVRKQNKVGRSEALGMNYFICRFWSTFSLTPQPSNCCFILIFFFDFEFCFGLGLGHLVWACGWTWAGPWAPGLGFGFGLRCADRASPEVVAVLIAFVKQVTPVGFETTPFRTGALSQRLRPLGQSVLFGSKI